MALVVRTVLDRELEIHSNRRAAYQRVFSETRVRSLELRASQERDLFPTQSEGGGLSCLALDTTCEDRFLLVGRGNGEIVLRDLWLDAPKSAIATCERGSAQEYGHKFIVKSLEWFGADNGLFVSGSRDKTVLAWDTAAFVPVCKFPLRAAVNCVRMSPIATGVTSKLIVCGTAEPYVRVCDLGSGSHSQILQGHRSAVVSCAWSPASEYVLVTGSVDQTIRVWDLRRSGESGCYAVLDQTNAKRRAKSSLIDMQNTSHHGTVMNLQFIGDGYHLLSSGSEGSLRLWQASVRDPNFMREYSFENTLMNYSSTAIGKPLAPSGVFAATTGHANSEAPVVFHAVGANGTSLACFDVFDGDLVESSASMSAAGHFMKITAIVYRDSLQELYTASLDGMLLKWSSDFPTRNAHENDDTSSYQQQQRDGEEDEEYQVDWVSDIAESDEDFL